jgi:tetraacyldisaccharide 4'-kinase
VDLERELTAIWYRPRASPVALALWPLSLAYRAVVGLRRALYRRGVLASERLNVPVVIVGNITVGGAGKTPLVRGLVSALADRGFHPGIVSRGYGGRESGPRVITPTDDPLEVGDESILLAAGGMPVAVGHDRAAAARAVLAAHPEVDVIVSDDGLQHYALARTVEIAAVDGARGLGDGLMLPAGPLREPSSRLASVDAVVTLVDDAAFAPSPDARATQMTHEALPWRNLKAPDRVADFSGLRPGELHAIAGIANPDRFFHTVRRQGLAPACHAFPDHHPFVPGDLAFAGARAILMTEKDAVKCARFADERMWCLPIRARIDPRLVALVEDRIRGRQTA